MEYITNTIEAVPFLMVSVIAAIIAMSSLAFFIKAFNNISLKEELSHKDNFAAGLSVSGALFSLGCVIAGASSGDFGDSISHELFLLITYIGVGLLTLIGSRYLFDRFSFPGFKVHDQIMKENTAVGIADMGNTIASGLIVYNIMLWVDSTAYSDAIYVIIAWALSQVVLFLATVYKNAIQLKFGKTSSISEQLISGNIASAIRFAGYRISIALAMMATSSIIGFDADHDITVILSWFGISLFFVFASTVIGVAIRKVVLRGIDVWDEVDKQGNVGIAVIQSVLFVVGSLIIIGVTR